MVKMRVLVACEFSGRVRDAFRLRGHIAYSCDIIDTITKDKNYHIKGDVTGLLQERWDLVIAHPPCTYLANSGVRWLFNNPNRAEDVVLGANFFLQCLHANADRICVENPIQHCYAKDIIKTPYTQLIQPYEFGHPETKATCLWLKGLPKLQPTNIVNGREPKIHTTAPGPYRKMIRSLTYHGIAEAMAEQWGEP